MNSCDSRYEPVKQMTAGHYAAMALLGLSCLPYFLSTETRRARRDGESSWVILWDAKYMGTLLEHMKHNFL